MTATNVKSVDEQTMSQPECDRIPTDGVTQDLLDWLQKQAKEYDSKYLLAHADDGVIWGYFKDNEDKKELVTADSVFHQLAKLRLPTLQQCRIFGGTTEVMLWCVGDQWQIDQTWQARFIRDEHLSDKAYISECQILWGTQAEDIREEFTLVSDGSQGLRHAVPLTNISFESDPERKKLYRPVRLSVRHYIDYDNDGLARIYLSRLVDLTTDPPYKGDLT